MSSAPKAPSATKILFGFHAVGVRLKTTPQSIVEVYFEPTRRDARMRQFLDRAKEAGVRLIESDGLRIAKLAGSHGHQGSTHPGSGRSGTLHRIASGRIDA